MAVHSPVKSDHLDYYNPDVHHNFCNHPSGSTLLDVYGLYYFDVEFHYNDNPNYHLSGFSGDIHSSDNVDRCCNLSKHPDVHCHSHI